MNPHETVAPMNDPSLKALLESMRRVVGACYPEAVSASLVVDRGAGAEPAVLPVAVRPSPSAAPPA